MHLGGDPIAVVVDDRDGAVILPLVAAGTRSGVSDPEGEKSRVMRISRCSTTTLEVMTSSGISGVSSSRTTV